MSVGGKNQVRADLLSELPDHAWQAVLQSDDALPTAPKRHHLLVPEIEDSADQRAVEGFV
jgi:hypothetical protein